MEQREDLSSILPSTGYILPFGLVDPWSPMRMMRQVLDTLDHVFKDAVPLSWGSSRALWEVREEENEVRLRLDFLGLSKEEVRVSVEDDMMVIKAEQRKEEKKQEPLLRSALLLLSSTEGWL